MTKNTNISSGIDLNANEVTIGGDVVGRDKITNITNNIAQQAQAAKERQPLRVLAVIAAPVAGQREVDPPPTSLSGRAEWKALRSATKVVPMLLARLRPPTALALRSICAPNNAGTYNIVHFICHGLPGALALEDERGLMKIITAAELAADLKEGEVHLAVINACYSAAGDEAAIAQALVEAGVRSVVAHRWPLIDPAAVLFSQALYRELAAGRSLRTAFDQAVSETTAQHQAEKGNATLLGDEALTFPRPSGEVQPSQVIEGAALPDEAARFFGRGRELIQLADIFAHPDLRGAALTGIGGIGKSALAFEAVDRLAWRFDERVAYVRASEFGFKAEDALNELARGLGIEVRHPAASELRDFVNRQPCLLLFDNMERAGDELDRLADFVSSFNLKVGSKALFTLRLPLTSAFTGMREINLHEGLDESNAIEYVRFIARTEVDVPQWQNPDNARTLVRRVSGHPHLVWLAIHLSKELPFVDLFEIVLSLSDELDVALQEMIGRLVKVAGDAAHQALARLTIFPQPRMIVGAAKAACDEVTPGLRTLVQHGVLALERDGAERYALHPTVLDWAKAHGDLPLAELHKAENRVLKYYVQWATENFNHFDRLQDEHDNVLAALDWARQAGEQRTFVDLTLTLLKFWDTRGYWPQTEKHLLTALEASTHLNDHAAHAQLTMVQGLAAYARDDFKEAEVLLRQSLAVALEYKVHPVALKSCYNLALVLSEIKEYSEAVNLLHLTLAGVAQDDKPDWGLVILCHQLLGKCLTILGDFDAAERELQIAFDLHKRYGVDEHKLYSYFLSGLNVLRRGLATARDQGQHALHEAQAVGDQEAIAEIETYLGKIEWLLERPDEARKHLQTAYEMAKRIRSTTIQKELETRFGDMIGSNVG
jgi:tetratricopeptide (TPR) repeat protein